MVYFLRHSAPYHRSSSINFQGSPSFWARAVFSVLTGLHGPTQEDLLVMVALLEEKKLFNFSAASVFPSAEEQWVGST